MPRVDAAVPSDAWELSATGIAAAVENPLTARDATVVSSPERKALQTTTLDWVREVVGLGAGEVVLNCMGSDGVRDGYDIEQLAAVRSLCPVPLVASGGAGTPQHFVDVFREADVDGALAATVFHDGSIPIPSLKATLAEQGVEVRS